MSADTIDVITSSSYEWHDDIRFYLIHGYAPPTLEFKKHRTLRLKETPYQFIDNVLFHNNYDGVFLKCLEKPAADKIFVDLHVGHVHGHYSGEATTRKVLIAGYYWTTLFKYSYNLVRKCEPCQKCAGKLKKPTFPLQHVIVQYPFQ